MVKNLSKKQPYHHGNLCETLLTAGEAALAELPLSSVTLREIARRSGVSHTAPKHYFPMLGDLLGEIAARGYEKFVVALACGACSSDIQTPEERLVGMVRAYFRFADANPTIYGLMFGKSDTLTLTTRLKTAMKHAWRQIEIATAELVSSTNATMAALTLWSFVHGLVMLKLAQRTPSDLSLVELEEDLVRTVVAGLKSNVLCRPLKTFDKPFDAKNF